MSFKSSTGIGSWEYDDVIITLSDDSQLKGKLQCNLVLVRDNGYPRGEFNLSIQEHHSTEQRHLGVVKLPDLQETNIHDPKKQKTIKTMLMDIAPRVLHNVKHITIHGTKVHIHLKHEEIKQLDIPSNNEKTKLLNFLCHFQKTLEIESIPFLPWKRTAPTYRLLATPFSDQTNFYLNPANQHVLHYNVPILNSELPSLADFLKEKLFFNDNEYTMEHLKRS